MRKGMTYAWRFALVFCAAVAAQGQSVTIQPADPADFPAVVDSNSPAYWDDGLLYVFNSLNLPIRSVQETSGRFAKSRVALIHGQNRWRWIESVWPAPDGTVYAWYHTEPEDVCPGQPLTAPEIGALASSDGVNFRDLGIVIRAADAPNCGTNNRYFAGGTGDFTVIPDRGGNYFYFLFSAYAGPMERQGIGVARLAAADLAQPAGKVQKFYNGYWNEPGLGGKLTPVFPAQGDWSSASPDAFWGPSVHWNTALEQYVVLLNHVAGDPYWGQEGIYVSFGADLSNPLSWTAPSKIMDGVGWYPQVLGDGAGETDSLSGGSARLFVNGHSEWRVFFNSRPAPPDPLEVTVTRSRARVVRGRAASGTAGKIAVRHKPTY